MYLSLLLYLVNLIGSTSLAVATVYNFHQNAGNPILSVGAIVITSLPLIFVWFPTKTAEISSSLGALNLEEFSGYSSETPFYVTLFFGWTGLGIFFLCSLFFFR